MNQYNVLVKGILKKGNKYLIVNKWYDDRIVDPYQWEFVNGEVMFGETPEKAVLRLIKDFSGMCAKVDKVLYVWNYMLGDVSNLGIAYLCETTDDEVELSEELHDYKWVEIEEFKEYITNEHILKDVTNALK